MLLTNEAHGALIHSFMVVMIAAEKQAFFLCAKKKKIARLRSYPQTGFSNGLTTQPLSNSWMGTENSREESAYATSLNKVETDYEWFLSNPRLDSLKVQCTSEKWHDIISLWNSNVPLTIVKTSLIQDGPWTLHDISHSASTLRLLFSKDFLCFLSL